MPAMTQLGADAAIAVAFEGVGDGGDLGVSSASGSFAAGVAW
jgi:hypothetical protein